MKKFENNLNSLRTQVKATKFSSNFMFKIAVCCNLLFI